MSKKKAIVVFLIFVGIGAAIVFLFPTFSIMNIPTYLQDSITEISQLPMQVLASIGGAIASISVVIGKLWSKLTQTKQQLTQAEQQVQKAENLVNSTQNYATEQIQNLNKTIEAKDNLLKTKDEKIVSLETQLANSPSQQDLEQLKLYYEGEVKALQNELDRRPIQQQVVVK